MNPLDTPPPPILYRAFGDSNAFYTPTPAALAAWLVAFDYDPEAPRYNIEYCRCWSGGSVTVIYKNGTVAVGGTDPARALSTLAALLRPTHRVEVRGA